LRECSDQIRGKEVELSIDSRYQVRSNSSWSTVTVYCIDTKKIIWTENLYTGTTRSVQSIGEGLPTTIALFYLLDNMDIKIKNIVTDGKARDTLVGLYRPKFS